MQYGCRCCNKEEYRDGTVRYRPCYGLGEIGFQIEQYHSDKQVAQHPYSKHTYRFVSDPEIQKISQGLRYHIQSPEKAQSSKAQILIMYLPQNKARNRKEEQSEKAYKNKKHKAWHGLEEKLIVKPVSSAIHDPKAIRKALRRHPVGIFYL